MSGKCVIGTPLTDSNLSQHLDELSLCLNQWQERPEKKSIPPSLESKLVPGNPFSKIEPGDLAMFYGPLSLSWPVRIYLFISFIKELLGVRSLNEEEANQLRFAFLGALKIGCQFLPDGYLKGQLFYGKSEPIVGKYGLFALPEFPVGRPESEYFEHVNKDIFEIVSGANKAPKGMVTVCNLATKVDGQVTRQHILEQALQPGLCLRLMGIFNLDVLMIGANSKVNLPCNYYGRKKEDIGIRPSPVLGEVIQQGIVSHALDLIDGKSVGLPSADLGYRALQDQLRNYNKAIDRKSLASAFDTKSTGGQITLQDGTNIGVVTS